jgi:hypothetical protein
MPPLRSFPREVLERVFLEFGIHLLQKFPDNQTLWGNQPMSKPYKSRSCMANRYYEFSSSERDFYDIFTIQAIIGRLGYSSKSAQIMAALEKADIEFQEKESG